ncbi:murein hydrolase activator EnvC family protein [Billgrantia gudaonensis]|uniref:Septal ring factor EnvC, activator of murein hydrolases AmiA and AmiB n=1 Tax=Billgrantia gudaonensis TaxID=376427 RepID=A0A1G8PL57_9GAMM|nr:peptidoglycan DD-metalloendopeptidase family protein [Halomonas gudaonensis]SDI93223.1 Septal ring factor EnvC, activator of murein hydrolases AmiA and AmiB [Halomonas gudaonensis]
MIRGFVRLSVFALAVASSQLLAQPSEREARERLDAIGTAIESASQRLATTREAQDEATQALRDVETALAETHRRLDAIQAERREVDAQLAELESARDDLQAERSDQVEALRAQLDALYRLGRTPQLKLLLNQDDPARLDRLQTYLNSLAEARHARLDAIAQLDAELDANQRERRQQRQRLDALADSLAERSAELADQVAERERLVAALAARHGSERARLAQLEQDREAAEQRLEAIRQELARLDSPPPSTAIERTQGELPWPVEGELAATFGNGDGVHRNGLLIRTAEGTPVTAVHAGRVVFAEWMRGFGNLVIVDHGDQVMTLYAHLQHFETEVGRALSRGDPLGAVGVSGGQRQPGLYFEVRRQGKPIDPEAWIAQR